MASNCIGRAVRFLCGVAVAMTAAIVAAADRPKLAPAQEGMLDCVLCIDNSGSMADEIEAVQQAVAEFIRDLKTFAGQNKIRLQFGLVTFARHGDPGWLQSWSLTSDAELIRRNILAMRIVDPRRGAGGREDMYAALMYAMDATVGGESIAMGWRRGAAKIILVAGDEAPDEPDWEARTLADVADRAEKLDPVHIYTLILPGQGPGFLDPTVRAISRLADATAGEAMRVENAKTLPAALIGVIQRAVRRHRDEIWSAANPPYGLFLATGFAVFLVMVACVAAVAVRVVQYRRSFHRQPVALAEQPDPELTGQSIQRPPES